jgi:hypothetical protein
MQSVHLVRRKAGDMMTVGPTREARAAARDRRGARTPGGGTTKSHDGHSTVLSEYHGAFTSAHAMTIAPARRAQNKWQSARAVKDRHHRFRSRLVGQFAERRPPLAD